MKFSLYFLQFKTDVYLGDKFVTVSTIYILLYWCPIRVSAKLQQLAASTKVLYNNKKAKFLPDIELGFWKIYEFCGQERFG